VSRYTTRKRALKSHGLSETPIAWRNTSETFTPRGLGYNSASCELVKCFELTESDGEMRCSCLRWQPACLQPCTRLVIRTYAVLCNEQLLCASHPVRHHRAFLTSISCGTPLHRREWCRLGQLTSVSVVNYNHTLDEVRRGITCCSCALLWCRV